MPEDHNATISGWLEQLKRGDRHARDQLLAHFGKRFEKLARRMMRLFPSVRRWEQTGDIIQNASLRMMRSIDAVNFKSSEHFLAHAALQIRRELIDLTRKYLGPQGVGANQQSWAKSQTDEGAMPDPQDLTHEPSRLAGWSEIHEWLADLPEEKRQVVEMIWYHGLTQNETAQQLGISERTVKRRWQAIRLSLHQFLQTEFPNRGEGGTQ